MIDGLVNADALPILERMYQFTGARHRLISANIANFDTPGYRAVDVSVEDFQADLADAVEERRRRHGNAGGELDIKEAGGAQFSRNGMQLLPEPIGDNILFHDGNDRHLERTMQSLTENFMTFRAAAELMRGQMDLLRSAIQERP